MQCEILTMCLEALMEKFMKFSNQVPDRKKSLLQ